MRTPQVPPIYGQSPRSYRRQPITRIPSRKAPVILEARVAWLIALNISPTARETRS